MAFSNNKRRPTRRRNSRMSEINVTPMVDVMLVLLIVFMVAAPMMQSGVDVSLPDSDAPAMSQTNEVPLSVTVMNDGRLFIQAEEVEEADLIPRLSAILENRESNQIFVRASGDNSYERVFKVMGSLAKAGFTDIGLVGKLGQ